MGAALLLICITVAATVYSGRAQGPFTYSTRSWQAPDARAYAAAATGIVIPWFVALRGPVAVVREWGVNYVGHLCKTRRAFEQT